jgi:hypothetical protein
MTSDGNAHAHTQPSCKTPGAAIEQHRASRASQPHATRSKLARQAAAPTHTDAGRTDAPGSPGRTKGPALAGRRPLWRHAHTCPCAAAPRSQLLASVQAATAAAPPPRRPAPGPCARVAEPRGARPTKAREAPPPNNPPADAAHAGAARSSFSAPAGRPGSTSQHLPDLAAAHSTFLTSKKPGRCSSAALAFSALVTATTRPASPRTASSTSANSLRRRRCRWVAWW